MKKILINILSSFVFFSCQGQGKNNTEIKSQNVEKIQQSMEEKIDLKQIARHIEFQKRAFVEDYTPDNEYIPTKEDLFLQQPLIEKSLVNNGYKIPEYSKFRERIKDIFGIDLDKSKETIVTLYPFHSARVRGIAYKDEELKYIISRTTNITFDEYKYSLSKYNGNLFIDKQRKIIAPMVFLEELIKINNVNKKDYEIKHNLKLSSLNKYLIYNDKASFTYLLSREKDFIHDLLLNFNYDEEDKINESVLDSLYTTYADNQPVRESELINLIFLKKNQTVADQLYIREGVLKTIENITNENNGKYAITIINGMTRILDRKREGKNINWTNEELYKMVAYAANYVDPLYWKYHESETVVWGNGDIIGVYDSLLSEEEWEAMLKQFEKNNYYNLLNLKGLVKEIMNW